MKKIDEAVLAQIKKLCYEAVLFEAIDQKSRHLAKELTRLFLDINDYKTNWIKCDEENNDAYMVDSGHIKLEISQKDFTGSQSEKIFTIIL